MLRLFFWPALLARELPTKILLFGYVELDPMYIITQHVKTLDGLAIFYQGIHPMHMVDSSALNIDEWNVGESIYMGNHRPTLKICVSIVE